MEEAQHGLDLHAGASCQRDPAQGGTRVIMPISICANALWYKRWGADEVLFYQVPVCGMVCRCILSSCHHIHSTASVSPSAQGGCQVSQSPEAVVLGLETCSLGTVSETCSIGDLQRRSTVQCTLLARLDVKHTPLQDLSLEIELPVKESGDFPS